MLNQQHPEVRHLYALIYGGFYIEAIKILDQFMKIDQKEPRWLAEKLCLFAETLRWQDFDALQKRLLTEFSGTAEAKLAEALTPGLNAVGRLKLLSNAIQLDPNFSKLFYCRGQVFRLLNSNRQALDDFDHCLDLAPGYYDVYLWRAKTYKAIGCYHQAIQDLMVYFSTPICKHRGPIYEELIRVLEEMKKMDLAFDIIADKHLYLFLDEKEDLPAEDPNEKEQNDHDEENGGQNNESEEGGVDQD